ncbi:MAG: InlB B-repeat-containing protein [Bacilli bacterium]|nr:InlB B-repeat-containing protein [Bacilli bacterium]
MKTVLKKLLIIAVISVLSLTAVLLCACNNNNTHTEKHIVISSDVTRIEAGAYKDYKNLETIFIPKSVKSVGANVFVGCENLTIYAEEDESIAEWDIKWNSTSRPAIFGCKFTDSGDLYFIKSIHNPFTYDEDIISNPYREGYEFDGWYTTDDFSGEKYDDIKSAPNGTLYSKWIKNN